MIEINGWMKRFLHALEKQYGDRVWFVGLQGSYGRGEATEGSDIDVVVVLDEVSASDIQAYHAMLDCLPYREKICGFFSGKTELMNWEPSDLFQFYYDTQPIHGNLDVLLSIVDDAAVKRAIQTGVCNIYHGCVHNMLHEKSEDILKSLYKSASFVVQAICFQQTGRYIRQQKELLETVSPKEQAVLRTCLHLKQGEPVAFDAMSELLFTWSGNWIAEMRDRMIPSIE